MTGPSVLPLLPSQQRLRRCSYRGYRGASAPAVYASRTVLPPPLQDSLPAGWLAFTGWELNPLGRNERFPNGYIPSPFPGFILTLDGCEHSRAEDRLHRRGLSDGADLLLRLLLSRRSFHPVARTPLCSPVRRHP